MSIEFNDPKVKARDMFYAMYYKTRIASKKDVQHCLMIALEYLKQANPDQQEYWESVKKEANLIWA